MKRTIHILAVVSLLASPAVAQFSGSVPEGPATGALRQFLDGQPMTNEIASLFVWQEDDELVVIGWLGAKASIEESIFVNIQPVFNEKGKKAKKKQLYPKMRERELLSFEFPISDALKVEARYATTGGRIQHGKTTHSERFDIPPAGQSMQVYCQRTAGLEQVQCTKDLIEGVPRREDVEALAEDPS